MRVLFSLPLKSRLQIQNWALGERYNMFCNEGTSSGLNELLSARSRLGLGCDPTEMSSVSKEAGLCWKLRVTMGRVDMEMGDNDTISVLFHNGHLIFGRNSRNSLSSHFSYKIHGPEHPGAGVESKAYEEDIPGGDKGNCIETTEQEVSFLRSGAARYEEQNRAVSDS
ncbi:hypothetical protein EK904_005225 [Melospiza melodia maxima]|nr:hypothetical protein EK904_005225 [Melospiza melodia maxima]